MPELEWLEPARTDLLAIVDYISDENPDAAQKLKDDIETKVAKLPEHPRLYRSGRIEGTREMIVRANYIVVYTEDPFTCAHSTCLARRPAMAATNLRRLQQAIPSTQVPPPV